MFSVAGTTERRFFYHICLHRYHHTLLLFLPSFLPSLLPFFLVSLLSSSLSSSIRFARLLPPEPAHPAQPTSSDDVSTMASSTWRCELEYMAPAVPPTRTSCTFPVRPPVVVQPAARSKARLWPRHQGPAQAAAGGAGEITQPAATAKLHQAPPAPAPRRITGSKCRRRTSARRARIRCPPLVLLSPPGSLGHGGGVAAARGAGGRGSPGTDQLIKR